MPSYSTYGQSHNSSASKLSKRSSSSHQGPEGNGMTNHGTPGSSRPEVDYLPSILLGGGPPSSGSHHSHHHPNTPKDTPDPKNKSVTPSSQYQSQGGSSPWTSTSYSSSMMDQQYVRRRPKGSKDGGLFRSMDGLENQPPLMSLFDGNHTTTTPLKTTEQLHHHNTPVKPHEEVHEGEYWVTVFGFPAESTASVVKQFQQYGQIVQFTNGSGHNWINVQYRTKLQAQLALSKNGQQLSKEHRMIIGVIPCTEPGTQAQITGLTKQTQEPITRQPASYANSTQHNVDLDILKPPTRSNGCIAQMLSCLGLI